MRTVRCLCSASTSTHPWGRSWSGCSSGGGRYVVHDYLRYKRHVVRQVYAWDHEVDERLREHEAAWPEYKENKSLVARPAYQRSVDASGKGCERWLENYLFSDVQTLQELKQHHVHTLDDKGARVPLTHCRRPDKPTACKSDFPRDRWLCSDPVIVCKGLADVFGLASTGRRSKLGTLHGPVNHAWLNGTHPALLAAVRTNCDVQLPWRFPITEGTHSGMCPNFTYRGEGDEDVEGADVACISSPAERAATIQAAQVAQDAQAGYICDYCCKRQPVGTSELREWEKGHRDLASKLQDKGTRAIGRRHALRLCSDCYGKGVVRGHVENTNLRAYGNDSTVIAAECITTTQSEVFYGRSYVNCVERLNDKRSGEAGVQFLALDRRGRGRARIVERDADFLYGYRPRHPDVWHLSPFEFCMYWEPKLLTYPSSPDHDETSAQYHAVLTAVGREKVANGVVDLKPRVDYVVKSLAEALATGHGRWLPFDNDPRQPPAFRHTWVLVRRLRPKVPVLSGCPAPRHSRGEEVRAAMITMAYMRPWTLRRELSSADVPYAGSLRARRDLGRGASPLAGPRRPVRGVTALRQQFHGRASPPTARRGRRGGAQRRSGRG